MLATYGLRIHEAWNIANWDKPVTLKNGDWIVVEMSEDEEISTQNDREDLIIPAVLDPENKDYILCIKHDTKTGYRMAMPLSPEGHDWIEEFKLLQPLNLPDIEKPLGKTGKKNGSLSCTNKATGWLKRHNYGFTPHDLRHACNHRGHRAGLNVDALAQSLGHSFKVNITTYRDSKSEKVKLQDLKLSISKEQNKRSEIEFLKEENQALKSQLEAAQKEIELLKTKIQLNETYQQSKNKK